MKKLITVLVALVLLLVSGCGMKTHYENSETVESNIESENSSQTVTQPAADVDKGNVIKEKIEYVLGEKSDTNIHYGMFDESAGAKMEYSDTYAEWKDSYATGRVDVIGKELDDINCVVAYSSPLVTVSDIQLKMQLSNWSFTNTNFYEIDITNDGYNDLVITYTYSTGTGSSQEGIYVYDIKNGKEIKPFYKDGVYFTDKQDEEILTYYKKWFNEGHHEIWNINREGFEMLSYEYFRPSIVEYKGKYALAVVFSDPAPNRYDGSSTAILVCKDDEFVVDNVWVWVECEK